MTVEAVFFDLDGTLLDTAPDLGGALNRVLTAEDKPELAAATIRPVVSNGVAGLLKLGFNIDANHPDFSRLRQQLLDFYMAHLTTHTRTFNGIHSLLKKLAWHNIRWGVVTNKPAAYAIPLLDAFSFASAPSCLICPDHVVNKKPHAEPLHLACKQTDCKPQNALYVGDHRRDIECGVNAHMPTIAAGYGYIDTNDNYRDWPADFWVQSADDIWPIINQRLGSDR